MGDKKFNGGVTMFKKIFLSIFLFIIILITTIISFNFYHNKPVSIFKKLESKINQTKNIKFTSYSNWLWHPGRVFIFDIIYMNIFSPGTAKMQIMEETDIRTIPAYMLETSLELSALFKKIYDVKMILTSAVKRDTKLSLWYRELSITPEKIRTKEIIFEPEKLIATREKIKFKIPDNTYDPLSVFFNLLDNEFVIGKSIILNLLSKEEIYEFKATPTEVKNNIYKLEGEVFRKDRSSTHGAKFILWMLDGNIRVPLLVKVITAAGSVYLRLKDVK